MDRWLKVEVYSEALAWISAQAMYKGMHELSSEAFKLSFDVYDRNVDLEQVEEKIKEFRKKLEKK